MACAAADQQKGVMHSRMKHLANNWDSKLSLIHISEPTRPY